jgi:hypothetical protein
MLHELKLLLIGWAVCHAMDVCWGFLRSLTVACLSAGGFFWRGIRLMRRCGRGRGRGPG